MAFALEIIDVLSICQFELSCVGILLSLKPINQCEFLSILGNKSISRWNPYTYDGGLCVSECKGSVWGPGSGTPVLNDSFRSYQRKRV